MTPELIALVLSLPLPVRLALLDADPTGAGWLVPVGASEVGNCYVAMRVTPYECGQVRDGAAWLPCNPLSIVRHAQRLHRKRMIELPPTAFLVDEAGAVTNLPSREDERSHRHYRLLSAMLAPDMDGTGERDYMNAVALLREVVAP